MRPRPAATPNARRPGLSPAPLLSLAPLLALLCVECGPAPPPPAVTIPPLPPAPQASTAPAGSEGSGACRVAYADGNTLCIQSLSPAALGERLCADLPAEIEQLSWAGTGDVAVLLGSGDVMLAGATKGAQPPRSLPLPPASTWDRPPPLDSSGKISTGAEPSGKAHLFTKGEEVWLAKCPWWFLLDAGWCHEWVSARLHPSPDVGVSSDEPPGFRELDEPTFDGAPPPGVDIHVGEVPAGEFPPLVCERGGQKSVFQLEGSSGGPLITVRWSWIPGSADKYVAVVTHDYGEAVHATTYLMRACESKPIEEETTVMPGPGHFWLRKSDQGWIALHGDRELGTIRGELLELAPVPR